MPNDNDVRVGEWGKTLKPNLLLITVDPIQCDCRSNLKIGKEVSREGQRMAVRIG